MNELIRCKACGLTIKDKKVKDICPACGVKRAAFEPYEDPVSANRRKMLDLHMHPIVVHFPQAFAILIPGMLLLSLIPPREFTADLLSTARIIALLLPLTVAASIFAGVIDGKIRFKKLSTPFLKKKITIGTALMILSGGAAAVVLTIGLTGKGMLLLAVLSTLCIPCEVFLSQIGIKLMFSVMRG